MHFRYASRAETWITFHRCQQIIGPCLVPRVHELERSVFPPGHLPERLAPIRAAGWLRRGLDELPTFTDPLTGGATGQDPGFDA
jgi:hypothetical protein